MPIIDPDTFIDTNYRRGGPGAYMFDYRYRGKLRSVVIKAESREEAIEEMRAIRQAVLEGQLALRLSGKRESSAWLFRAIGNLFLFFRRA